MDRLLLQHHEGLDQADCKSGTPLVEVQTPHVLGESQLALNDTAGRWHEVVGCLGNQDQTIDFIRLEITPVDQMTQAKQCQVGRTRSLGNQSVPVDSNHVLQFS